MHAILYARALGLPTIYEIDDLLFEADFYPDPFESFEGQITAEQYAELHLGVPLFRYAMRLCDIGLASTPALALAMQRLVRSGVCHVLRNGLDERTAPFLTRPPAPFSCTTLTIFYGSGTKAHNKDFTDLAAPALIHILKTHPHIRLVIAGYLHLDKRFVPFARRVLQLGFTSDVAAYWEVLSGADINLAVLAETENTDVKSEIKWLEAAMCGIPSIVSPTLTYREILVDGEDVLMAATSQEWSRALDALVTNADLRRKIGAQARAKALAAYGLDDAVATLASFLPPPANPAKVQNGSWMYPVAPSRLITRYPRAPTHEGRRRRLLIVNVYFPPQTTGGATRVVKDNVDYLLDHATDNFEIAVVAADENVASPYQTRIDNYRGVPVYRISSPQEANMDWRPLNPAMQTPFEDLLDRFEPDLIHFHCVQRLTGSVVEAASARDLPYIITLHDAWWISDFQFLVNDDGQVELPSSDPLTPTTSHAFNSTVSIARRRNLGRLLDGAKALLTVSETFAALYRDAGYPRTIAIPNGVSTLTAVTRRPSKMGRVRLGHLGNRTLHKGATLIEVVLRANSFRNLALTLVDHAYGSDYVREEVWGKTPVTIIGVVPQEHISELYAKIDVLLAPSVWPESFGLVTREARAAGLWVIASDRGAIGEDIREGVDGHRVDVSNAEGLCSALRLVDAMPERYLASPPSPDNPTRTSNDQGADLIFFYQKLLS